MAIIWADGFDHYGTGAGAAVVTNLGAYGYQDIAIGPFGFSATNARTGNAWVNTSQRGFYFRRVLDAPVSNVLGIVAAFRWDGTPHSNVGAYSLAIESAIGTRGFNLQFFNDLSIVVRNGAGVAVGQTPPNAFTLGSWDSYEIKFDMTNGIIQVRKNGVTDPILTVTGLTIPPATSFIIGSPVDPGAAPSPTWRVDDVVVWDGSGTTNNNWLGDRKCATLFPNANGTLQDWVPNTGNAFAAVAQVPPGVNYISSSVAGNISEFDKAPVPALTTSIAGLVLFAAALKTDAGTASYRIGANKSGVVRNSPIINPGTSMSYGRYIMQTDPDGLAWTRTTLDAARIRITREA